MKGFLNLLARRTEPEVSVRLRYTGPLTTQKEQDDLAELLWRQRVQQNIERRRALAILGEPLAPKFRIVR